MLARVKKYKEMIERTILETDAANLNNAVMSTADNKLSSSLYYVLGLTTTDESKSHKIVRNVAVREGAIALHKLLAEYQPDIVNRHLGLLMSTMNWSIHPTDPVTAINELDLRINAYELQSGEKMAGTVKRGLLLKGLAALPEEHVMKDSARLNTYAQTRAEVVDLLRAEAALRMPMDVDGALPRSKGKGKTKGKGKPDDQKGKGKSHGKGKKGKPESVTSATNLEICVRTVRCAKNVWPRKVETKRSCSSRGDSGSARSNGRNVGVH